MAARRLGAWLLPSDAPFDILRIVALNAIFAMFFLYLGCFVVQPGSSGYEAWADALVSGASLAGSAALTWRDVGYCLILLIGGFPWTHSFIGLTIITACMGLALPVFAYFALRPWFPAAAYWAAMASVVLFAPLIMFKVVHHDQPYIFFMMIAVWSFNRYQWGRRPVHPYGLALSVFAMSLIRLVGQGMYPPLLLLSWLQARVNVRHVLASALLFAACTVTYSAYRDRVLGTPPSILAKQVFYNLYTHMRVGRLAISPEFGPNTKRLIEHVHELLLPSPAESKAVMDFAARGAEPGSTTSLGEAAATPLEFMQNYFFSFTADALTERMFRRPNLEYQFFILEYTDDHLLLMVAYEIALRHPEYIMGYALENAFKLLYDPGYTQGRFLAYPFIKEGLVLPFSSLGGGYGYNVGDDAPEPAMSEARFLPLAGQPVFIKDVAAQAHARGRRRRRACPSAAIPRAGIRRVAAAARRGGRSPLVAAASRGLGGSPRRGDDRGVRRMGVAHAGRGDRGPRRGNHPCGERRRKLR